MQVSFRCLLPHLECPEPSEWSDWDDMEDTIEIELLSLSNPRSSKGDGNLGDRGLWSPGGEALVVLNLKGCWAGGFTQGHPGPLAFTLWFDMACAMAL